MTFHIRRDTARSALAMGLAAGAWFALAAFTPPASLPTAPSATQAGPDRILVAQAAARATYTSEQADRGEKRYKENCSECHGDDLNGGLLGGPPLRGVSFENKYAKGAPAGLLYEVMSGTMPPNAPGRYSPANYADLMAFILKRNGFKAGADLPSDVEALYNLVLEK
ncbi:MAG: hypothetical protein ABS75_24765 [Pelagibacterium sp. SCN 63-23]|nr:MAG: hypothetical protein ABS75_24765 [Pelagibacterium sp. SCN 63-23]